MRGVGWLAVFAVLAGCVGIPAPPVEAPETTASSHLPTFLVPVPVMAVTATQGEFFAAVSADAQTVLACTHGGFTGPTPKFVSRDRGETWTRVTPSAAMAAAGDCFVDIGDDGTWYFLDSQVAGTTVSSSSDGGRSWSASPIATPPVAGSADRPLSVPLGGASLGISYIQNYLLPGSVAFTRSDDRGASWSSPVLVVEPDPERSNRMHGPPFASDDRQTVWIPLMRFRAHDFPSGGPAQSELFFAVSRDGGRTWSEQPVLGPTPMLFAPPAVARAGANVYWAYQVPNGSAQDLFVIVSADGGATWRDPVRVAGGWSYLGYMWMSGAPDGSAVLSFDADAAPLGHGVAGEHVILIRLDADAPGLVSWAAPVAPASNAEFSTVEHDGFGRLYVSYRMGGDWLFLREADPGHTPRPSGL